MISMRPCAKSDSSLISRFSFAAALASLTLLLFACPNPTSTDLVLSVVSTIPADGATNFDPGQTLAVTFNRDLDPSCLNLSPVTISPNPGSSITLSFAYDSAARMLSIEPHPFLESNHAYTVSLETTIKDASGATLPKTVDLSFTTGDQPAGDIQFSPNVPYLTTPGNPPVTLSIKYNDQTRSMRIANDRAGLSDPNNNVPLAQSVPWLLTSDDGKKTVYVQFFDSSNKAVKSAVRSASITCDTLAPTIKASISAAYYTADNTPYYNMFNNSLNPLRGAADAVDATSGVASYSWTSTDPNVNFDILAPNSAQSPAIWIGPNGSDKPYELTLSVKDNAGNESSQSFAIIKYTAHPGQPTEGLGSDSHKPPIVDQDPTVTWKWVASSNIDSPPDTFIVKLETETTWTSLPLSTTSLSKSSLPDGIYRLQVIQMDAVGNQSNPLIMQIVVTPVVPWDDSTTTTDSVALGWRNFFGPGVLPAGAWYHVHLWPYGDTNPEDAVDYSGTATIREKLVKLSPGQTYDWYIEWSFDGGNTYLTGNRSPSNDPPQTPPPYHQFTAF